ncbi:MAG TPA: hypothetical protein VEY12_05470 [Thermoplasmata archaeon]|nr:hypothetical protein [Thermoplasmata archaeon]
MADDWAAILDVALKVVTLGLGILGAVAFYWQYRQRRARRIMFLNRAVFKPWSKVEVRQRSRSMEGRPPATIRLAIPAEAVPKDVDPTVPSDGLDIEELRGAADGEGLLALPLSRLSPSERVLRAKCRQAWREWQVVREWVRKYEATRERRRALLEGRVTRDMAATYPTLRPTTHQRVELNTYVPANILAREEEESDWCVNPDYTRVQLGASRYSDDHGGFVREIADAWPLLRASEEIVADAVAFNHLRDTWIDDPAIKELATEMAGQLDALEKAAARFRELVRDIAFYVDLEFPSTT